jgi:hypothetical protein
MGGQLCVGDGREKCLLSRAAGKATTHRGTASGLTARRPSSWSREARCTNTGHRP